MAEENFTEYTRTLDPEITLARYANGYYCMGSPLVDDIVCWHKTDFRAIFNINAINIPRSTRREVLKRKPFEITVDENFAEVIDQCAHIDRHANGSAVWITEPLINVFNQLHDQGHMHSVECHQDGKLVGGIFGLAMGRAFFALSMFSAVPNASKVAFTHMAARLWHGGFTLIDSQTPTDHLTTQFGQELMPLYIFNNTLDQTVRLQAAFDRPDMPDQNTMVSAYINHLDEQKSNEQDKNENVRITPL